MAAALAAAHIALALSASDAAAQSAWWAKTGQALIGPMGQVGVEVTYSCPPLEPPYQGAIRVDARQGNVTGHGYTLEATCPASRAHTYDSTGPRRAEVLMALGIFQRATADQLWKLTRPANRHDKLTRDALLDLQEHGMVRIEAKLEGNRNLWVLTRSGHREARSLLPKDVRLSSLRTEGSGTGYDRHALAVTSTAAEMTKAGLGTLLSWQTEVGHKLPGGFVQYADLTLRAPAAGVPVMLLEVDRLNESVDDLVHKLQRYTAWFELLASQGRSGRGAPGPSPGGGGPRVPAVAAGRCTTRGPETRAGGTGAATCPEHRAAVGTDTSAAARLRPARRGAARWGAVHVCRRTVR